MGWDGPGHPGAAGHLSAPGLQYAACPHAARTAIAPLEHAALLREMRAFRRIASGLPLND